MRWRASAYCLCLLGLAAGCWAEFPSTSDFGQLRSDASRAAALEATPVGIAVSARDARPGPPLPPCLNSDNDSDSWTSCAGDCDDSNPLVRPGQKLFFAKPTAKGSFDYDCDGLAQQQLTAKVACSTDGGGCSGEGWQKQVPECGNKGSWVVCHISSKNGKTFCTVDEGKSSSKTQACR